MASDQRWTGGLANREWQSGNRVEQPVDRVALAGQVKRYLLDCERFSLAPSEDTALKVIFHGNGAMKQAIREIYADAVRRATVPGQPEAQQAVSGRG